VHAGAQPYIQLVVEHEAHEAARASADAWLDKMLVRTGEAAIAQFLREHWLRVMEDACLDGGTVGDRWLENAQAIDDLLWTLLPKPSIEERQKSAALIPTLIKRLNAGLDSIGVAREDRVPFFNACFALQTAALRNRIEPLPPPVAAPASSPAARPAFNPASAGRADAADAVCILEQQGKLLQYIGASAGGASWRSPSGGVRLGDWVSFELPDGERLCGRVCWQGASFGTVLLFNKAWGYAVAIAARRIEAQLRGGRARIVSEISLFDTAAQTALGQMKSTG
jgi:hypothetical protein